MDLGRGRLCHQDLLSSPAAGQVAQSAKDVELARGEAGYQKRMEGDFQLLSLVLLPLVGGRRSPVAQILTSLSSGLPGTIVLA